MDSSFTREFWISIDFGPDSISLLVFTPNCASLETFVLHRLYYISFTSHLAIFAVCLPHAIAQLNGVVDTKFSPTSQHNRDFSRQIGLQILLLIHYISL